MIRGLYIHFPFCRHICNYCDFYVLNSLERIDEYLKALELEINLFFDKNPQYIDSKISTIYFGGGTPSLMSSEQVASILNLIKSKLDPTRDLEFSMEANPGTFDEEKLKQFKELGLSRISFGVQSFVKKELGVLTRDHSPKSAIKAIQSVSNAGIKHINLDLIFSIPEQTKESLKESLDTAISLPIDHISTYSLIYEPGTKLYNDWKANKISKQSDDFDAELYEFAIDYLTSKGFEQYEVSNFALNEAYSKHNLHAWNRGEYFAFGVSSHGFLDEVRFSNKRDINLYINELRKGNLPRENEEKINPESALEEKIFLGLRAKGICLKELKSQYTDVNWEAFTREVLRLSEDGYLEFKKDEIKLTKKAYLICDSVTFQLISTLQIG